MPTLGPTPVSITPGPPGRLRHGPALRRLSRDAMILLSIAAATELTVRAVAPRYLHHRTDARFTGGYPIQANRDGSRGTPFAVEKPQGTVRILCLGDSATFGTGVAADQTFAIRLGPAVQARTGRPTESINAGVPAAAVKDLQRALEEHWAVYRPDVVILAVSGNCASWAWVRRDDPPRHPSHAPPSAPPTGGGLNDRAKATFGGSLQTVKALRHRLALPSFLRLNAERALYAVGLLDHLVNPQMPLGALPAYGWSQLNLPEEVTLGVLEEFDRELDAFVESARRLGVPVVVTLIPPAFTISDLAIDNPKFVPRERLKLDFGARIAARCSLLGVPYADVGAALREARRQAPRALLYRQMDYTHLEPPGHEVAAEAIARTLLADHRSLTTDQ
jgi:lysophospholipase L1-like esterase